MYGLVYLIFTILVLVTQDIKFIGIAQLYGCILLLFFFYKKHKSIELMHFWIAGIMYIIIPEVILTSEVLETSQFGFEVIFLIFMSNAFFVLGYSMNVSPVLRKGVVEVNRIHLGQKIMVFLLILLYVFNSIGSALETFGSGRIGGESTVGFGFLNSIISSLGVLLPSVCGYMGERMRSYGIERFLFLYFLPLAIFAMLFMQFNRFPMLFAVLGYAVVRFPESILKFDLTIKKVFTVGLILGSLMYSSILVKKVRTLGVSSVQSITKTKVSTAKKDVGFHETYAKAMSNEGVLDMNRLSLTYFSEHPHTYGLSSSYVFYFWIPRVVWTKKPKMLGYWLVRKFRTGFSSGHSTSFGFIGELFADFGYFSILFALFLGRGFKKLQTGLEYYAFTKDFSKIGYIMTIPFTFFFVRSPVTATINLVGMLLFYNLLKFIFRRA